VRVLVAGAALAAVAPSAVAAPAVDVRVIGVSDEVRDNVLAALSIATLAEDEGEPEDGEDGRTATRRVERLHERAPEEILAALRPYGFYRAEVDASLERGDDGFTATYVVAPGPPLRITGVDLSVSGPGRDEPGFAALVRGFPLAEGEPLVQPLYEDAKDAFLDHAHEQGWLDAAFDTAEIRIDLARYTADVVLDFHTGPRYRYGPVTFRQTVLKPELLRGYVRFEPGDPVRMSELVRLQALLGDSPYFRRVEVQMEPEQARDLHVPIEVRLWPAPRQRWEVGAGYGTDTGPRGHVAFDHRLINRDGHRARAELILSEIERSFVGKYIVPGAYPRTDVITYSLGWAERAPDTSTTTTGLVGISRSESRGRWRETLSLAYRREDFTVGVDRGHPEMIVPEIAYSRVEADDRIFATRGFKIELSARGADESVASDVSFGAVETSAGLVRAFGPVFRVHGRARVGRLFTNDFRELPPTARWFAGGDRSVRGFDYESLGERDEEGNVIGGEALVTVSVELDAMFYEHERWGRWGAATFLDAGNATAELGEPLERGAGVGARWLSPIGLVRLDVAWALSEPGTPWRIHLTVGPDL